MIDYLKYNFFIESDHETFAINRERITDINNITKFSHRQFLFLNPNLSF